jgi:cystathionine beta-lyase
MQRHWENGVKLAQALALHPAVERVLHPALPDHPGHAIWRRDFEGASGLFGVQLKPMTKTQLSCFFKALRLFGIGLSWGGYESLALLVDPLPARCASAAIDGGPLLRIHAGLESVQDLIADMSQALDVACNAGADDGAVRSAALA